MFCLFIRSFHSLQLHWRKTSSTTTTMNNEHRPLNDRIIIIITVKCIKRRRQPPIECIIQIRKMNTAHSLMCRRHMLCQRTTQSATRTHTHTHRTENPSNAPAKYFMGPFYNLADNRNGVWPIFHCIFILLTPTMANAVAFCVSKGCCTRSPH